MGSYLTFYHSPMFLSQLHTRNSTEFTPWKDYSTCRYSWKRKFILVLKGKASTVHAGGNSDDDGYGGWFFQKVDASNRTAGIPKAILAGIGTSALTILLAAIAYCSFSRKGFRLKLCSPVSVFHDILEHFEISKGIANDTESVALKSHDFLAESTSYKSGVLNNENITASSGENKLVVISVPADSIQLEAFHALKMLKIIECDARADDLCTRREFARWLLKTNCLLERKAKHRIIPMFLIGDLASLAFDDVNIDDSDFWFIQALGEAGIVSSRLSLLNSSLSDVDKSTNEERFYFFPNNFISRLDLVNWRAILEYAESSELIDKILQTKPRLLDLSAGRFDASPQLLMDLISGDESIVTRTFGNIRRLQPNKLVTKAQAAVAITSGQMAKAINNELSRLEIEDLSKLSEMEEIRHDLIHRGDIQKHWEQKINMEKKLALQIDGDLENALFALQIASDAEDGSHSDYLKRKMSLECQQQILQSLKKEVDEMGQKLSNDREIWKAEKQNMESRLKIFQEKKDAVLEGKSGLEGDKEALQTLRSWVEEEARRVHSRANVLEQAARRWSVGGHPTS